ncbi:MAG: DUF2723 domain-containing protein [Candidatus Syntrophosphaera sp.]|nr:DUF2723 domain-containing protein [Candidatus Syntrophosphaera sp.]
MSKAKPDIKHIKRQIQKAGSAPKGKPEYKVPEKPVAVDESEFRPQPLVPRRINTIVAWAVFAFALIIYLLTQARSLSFWDSGEYATCISILGVPHPPGNPFYIIFGRALVALFGGILPHAWIAAFISVLTSAFAVMFTYLITVQLTSMFKIKYWESIFAGVIAALLTAFSFTFWMNAVEAEVYSGLVFFVNIIIWLTLLWVQKSRDFHKQNYLLLILYLFFLGFCVHQTALQIAPAILFIVVYPLMISGLRKGNFWYKFVGYGAALIISYLIFGAIGRSLNIDAFDQMGFALCVLVLMFIELRHVFDKRLWFLGFALVLIGLSAHVYLPIRAADRPFINLADPSTSQRFDDYIQRRQYKAEQETSMFVRRGNLITHQLDYHFLRYFGWQWFKADSVNRWAKIPIGMVKLLGGLLVTFLGLFGAVFHARKNKHSFRYFLAIFICTSVLMVFVMNLSSSEVRDRDYFYVVAYNMWAIWMGIGALGVVHLIQSKAAKYAMIAILGLLPLFNMGAQYLEHDRSREFIALDYGVNFLNSLEENAIIFTNGDNDTYPIWYAQAVEDPFVTEHMHPSSGIYPTPQSQAAIAQALAIKNAQLKGIRKDVTVANLSLLNTSWYIRQLRDLEGVLINLSEEHIDSLDDRRGLFQDYLWKDTVTFNAGDPSGERNFTINYLENYRKRESDGGFYPQRGSDFAVIQIIRENFGKRPIYFAVTCESNVGFDDYLRNEGMVSRLVHYKDPDGQQINIERLLANIDEVYQYRSIFDDRVFKDDNMSRLIMNYGSGYTRAAIHFTKQKEFDLAQAYAEKARQYIDNELRMTEYYIRLYAGTGQWDKVDQFIEVNIFPHPDAVRIYNSYVLNIFVQDYPRQFTNYMQKFLLRYPNEIDYATLAFYYGERYDLRTEVEAMFDSLQGKLGYTWDDIYRYMYGAMSGQSGTDPGLLEFQ